MLKGKKRPAWMDEIKSEAERKKAIDGLTRDDVFRSQFRAGEIAPKSDLEIIDWGLNRIERLRKSAAEERDEKSRRMGTMVTIGSLGIAALSIFSSAWLQLQSMREQRELKQYEVSFKPKQEAYSNFMSAFTKAMLAANAHEQANVFTEFSRMDLPYFLFEPFLPTEKRVEVFGKFSDFMALAHDRLKSTLPNAAVTDKSTESSFVENK